MRKKWICFFTGMMMLFSALPFGVWGQGYSRHITADFYDFAVRVDHLPVSLEHKAFIFDDHIYMSLQDMVSVFNLEGGYDERGNIIRLSSGGMLRLDGGSTLASELLQKDYEIASIERQIEALEKELEEAEEKVKEERTSRNDINTLSGMRSYLRDHFEYLEDIPMTIDFVRIDTRDYEVAITFPPRYHNDFERLSRRTIEYYLDDIFYAIRELYDEDARVEGFIRDNRSRDYTTYVEFDTWRNSLRYDFKRSAHRNSGMLLPSFIASSTMISQHVSRVLPVRFQSMEVEIDGKKLNWFREPFLYDDEIYLSLDDLAEVLYFYYNFNSDENLLEVSTNANMSSVTKDLSLSRLIPRLEELREEVAFVRGARYPYRNITSVSSMQSYLRVYFGELEDIPMSINLQERRDNSYRLNIRFSDRYRWEFEDIERHMIEGWLDDIFYAIRGLYDSDATIFGDIRDTRSSNITYLEFDTKDDVLVFDFHRSSHRNDGRRISGYQLEQHLYEEARRYDGIIFDYEVIVNRNDIDLVVSFSNHRFANWSPARKMDYLQFLLREIDYDINVNGLMLNTRDDEVILRFSFEDNKVRSFDLLEETEEFLEEDYGEFRSGGNRLRFTYFIREKSPEVFEVRVEGDFAKEDAAWRNIEANYMASFEDFMKDALSYVQYVWGVTVLGEVLDKNMTLLTTVDVYDDIVRPVYATPSGGSIASGALVELWSNTSGVDIFYTMRVNGIPSDPTTSSTRYGNRIAIDGVEGDTVTIKAFAVRDGMTSSGVSTFTYDIKDVSSDLENIIISNNPEGFDFKPSIYVYENVRVAEDIDSITITAVGKGRITIDGKEVTSGSASAAIPLSPGVRKTIEVAHEEGDRERRVYRIEVLRQVDDSPVIEVAVGHFGTGIVGVFNGKLVAEGNPNYNFDGYRVVLLSKSPSFEIGGTDNPYTVSSNGEFSITGFDISTIAKLIGYHYEIYNPERQLVGGGDL